MQTDGRPEPVLLWLDDVRPAPAGWMWVKTVDEAIETIKEVPVAEVSLDYDLDHTDGERKGIEVMYWLGRAYEAGDLQTLPVIHVHTANPLGGRDMALMWRAMELLVGQVQ